MTMTVQGPGGITIQFPDGTDAGTVDKVMRQAVGGSQAPAAAPNAPAPDAAAPQPAQPNNDPLATVTKLLGIPGPQQAAAAVRGAVDTGTFGFGDEGAAALGVKPFEGNWGGQYQAGLDKVRGEQAAAQQAHPAEYLGGQVGGAVATSFIPGLGAAGDVAKGASLGAKVLGAAKAGVLTGAAYGAGSANGDLADRALGAGEGALIGAGTGAAVPVLGKVAGAAFGGAAAAPTMDAIQSQKSALYDAAKQAGVVIRPQAFANLGNRLGVALKSESFSPDLEKGTASAVANIQRDIQAGVSPSLEDLDNYRKGLVKTARMSSDAADRHMAGTALDAFDHWAGDISPRDAQAGDPKAGFALVGQARDLARTQAKAQKIEDVIYDGTGNIRPADEIRNGFTALRKNKKALRGFTDDEKQAVYTAARGGSRTAKVLNAFAPKGPVTGMIYGWLASVAPPLAATGAAVTTAGRIAYQRGTMKAAQAASAIARNGGVSPGPSLRALAIGNGVNNVIAPAVRGAAVPSLLNLLPH